LPNELIEKLAKDFVFSIQKQVDEKNSAVRFVTSWATRGESVEALCNFLKNA
jgi:threonine aldolase